MARYKPCNYAQRKFIPVAFEEQILPGTFEYTVNYLIDHELSLRAFDRRYRNDTTGASAYHSRTGSDHANLRNGAAPVRISRKRSRSSKGRSVIGWIPTRRWTRPTVTPKQTGWRRKSSLVMQKGFINESKDTRHRPCNGNCRQS